MHRPAADETGGRADSWRPHPEGPLSQEVLHSVKTQMLRTSVPESGPECWALRCPHHQDWDSAGPEHGGLDLWRTNTQGPDCSEVTESSHRAEPQGAWLGRTGEPGLPYRSSHLGPVCHRIGPWGTAMEHGTSGPGARGDPEEGGLHPLFPVPALPPTPASPRWWQVELCEAGAESWHECRERTAFRPPPDKASWGKRGGRGPLQNKGFA